MELILIFSAHKLPQGKNSDAYPLDFFINKAVILDGRNGPLTIDATEYSNQVDKDRFVERKKESPWRELHPRPADLSVIYESAAIATMLQGHRKFRSSSASLPCCSCTASGSQGRRDVSFLWNP